MNVWVILPLNWFWKSLAILRRLRISALACSRSYTKRNSTKCQCASYRHLRQSDRTVISDASAGLPDNMVVTVVRADSAEAPAPIVYICKDEVVGLI